MASPAATGYVWNILNDQLEPKMTISYTVVQANLNDGYSMYNPSTDPYFDRVHWPYDPALEPLGVTPQPGLVLDTQTNQVVMSREYMNAVNAFHKLDPIKPVQTVDESKLPQELRDWLDTAGDVASLPAEAAKRGYVLENGVYVLSNPVVQVKAAVAQLNVLVAKL